MPETPKVNMPSDPKLSHCIAGLSGLFLIASTNETRQAANDLLNDLLVAYNGVERKSETRSADEVRQDLFENGRERLAMLEPVFPRAVHGLARQLTDMGVIAPLEPAKEKNWQHQIQGRGNETSDKARG